jgi:hypothetical protein
MPGPKTPDTAPGSQYPLPFGQGRGEPAPRKDTVQERLDNQIAAGFEKTAQDIGIPAEQVRMVQDALGQDSPRAFELIRKGMSPNEAIDRVRPRT